MNRPKFLILDFKEALEAFLYVVQNPNLPTIDVECVISEIFTCLTGNDVAINETAYYAGHVVRQGIIIENLSEVAEGTLDVIEQSIYDLGLACYAILREIKAYDQDGAFMYRFKGIIDDSSLLFEEIPSV